MYVNRNKVNERKIKCICIHMYIYCKFNIFNYKVSIRFSFINFFRLAQKIYSKIKKYFFLQSAK